MCEMHMENLKRVLIFWTGAASFQSVVSSRHPKAMDGTIISKFKEKEIGCTSDNFTN
jgi:hypothetical protein